MPDVNVSTDVALCRGCGRTFSYARLLEEQTAAPMDPDHPPKGVWFRRDMTGFEVGATTRSAAAFFLVPFMCVWSGFSLGGIYGTQILKGQFNLMTRLFGIPFLLGTLLFGSVAMLTVCGKVVVRVEGKDGVVFTGAGVLIGMPLRTSAGAPRPTETARPAAPSPSKAHDGSCSPGV